MCIRVGGYVRVSTDEQKENGYSIDAQLRMINDHCKKNDYSIVDIYNDAGHSGKDLMRPDMQRLLKDIKAKKIDMLVAIKVDRLTRNNYDGFWLLNFCEEHEVKIELILEPYDVSTATGEMMFGMNLVFGQKERKEISARTKRAMEEMALGKIHPAKAPYGYIRNKETGHLEIEPIEAQVVKEIFELYSKGHSMRGIANTMKENDAYLKQGKWKADRIYKMLTNPIYIGTFAYGRYRRKEEDILKVDNYCEPIIDDDTWKITRINLEKNKHPNYGEHIHIFTSIVRCPDCGNILSSNISYKYDRQKNKKDYYYLTCKNINCKSKGLHYSCDKIEKKLGRVLDELTRYMYDNTMEIITCNSNKSKEIKDIDKAIEKLREKEKRLVDLYISSTLPVDTINQKNEMIKKEIKKLLNKKEQLDPNDIFKEYAVELLRKLDCKVENNIAIFNHKLGFAFIWNSLNRKAKKEILNKIIASIEITRDKNYNIDISNIRFTDEFISKSSNEYLEYLNTILQNNDIGIKYKEKINEDELDKLSKDYNVIFLQTLMNNQYPEDTRNEYLFLLTKHFYTDGIISCPYFENSVLIDHVLLVPKIERI